MKIKTPPARHAGLIVVESAQGIGYRAYNQVTPCFFTFSQVQNSLSADVFFCRRRPPPFRNLPWCARPFFYY